MLSLYRAWLGPSPSVARPGPPPGAHRPVPRRAAPASPPPASPASSCSELDVEAVDPPAAEDRRAVLDVACCDGPVTFSRVLNAGWRDDWARRKRPPQYYPCKSCGCKFPSYYFVHKHRKRCHRDEQPEPSTSAVCKEH